MVSSRKIAFRAWDGKDMTYTPFSPYDNRTVDMNEQFRCLLVNGLKLMQFTGLHDKNGKEIYEGDIIMPYGKQRVTQTYKKTSKKRVVKWVEPQGGRGLGRSGFNLSRGTYEIIGNIYENPTLLPTNEPL